MAKRPMAKPKIDDRHPRADPSKEGALIGQMVAGAIGILARRRPTFVSRWIRHSSSQNRSGGYSVELCYRLFKQGARHGDVLHQLVGNVVPLLEIVGTIVREPNFALGVLPYQGF